MLIAFAETVRGVNSMSFRQEITPPHLLGRVTSAFWVIISIPLPFGAALTTALAARAGVGQALFLTGVASVAVTFVGLFTAIRTRRDPGPR